MRSGRKILRYCRLIRQYRLKTLRQRDNALQECNNALHFPNNAAHYCYLKARKHKVTPADCRIRMCRGVWAKRLGDIAKNL